VCDPLQKSWRRRELDWRLTTLEKVEENVDGVADIDLPVPIDVPIVRRPHRSPGTHMERESEEEDPKRDPSEDGKGDGNEFLHGAITFVE